MLPATRIIVLLFAIALGLLYKKLEDCIGAINAPSLPLDQWWGDGQRPKNWTEYVGNNSEIVNNKLIYPNETIDNLRELLNRPIRTTEPLEGIAFEYGFNSKFLNEIVEYWRNDYLPRWRGREVFLWQFNHFTTDIQGLRMHFLHLMNYDDHKKNRHHYPVLLLHGWPGSIREFYSIINKLHVPEDNKEYVFDVIAPSLPGYAWSQGTSKRGLGPAQMAVIVRNLMLRLGYKKFFIQGGDWGSVIGSHIATLFPENVLGYHSNYCLVLSAKAALKGAVASLLPSTLFAPRGYSRFYYPMSDKFAFLMEESGYMHLQATKPDTIGSALTGNPVGLAAYILEKFSTWTNPDFRKLPNGGLDQRFKFDTLLDNVMIYYFTNSITTSQRLYKEAFSEEQLALNLDRVPTAVPTGCARFKYDLIHQLDFQLRDKYTNLIHSTHHNKGGHFAALEVPSILYDDFIEFVKKVEKFSQIKQ